MESLYVGPDFAIGKKRLGNIKYLNDNQSKFNYHLDISNPYTMNNEIIRIDLKMCRAFGIKPDLDRIARADGQKDARKD